MPYYLYVPGVDGGSRDAGHVGWFTVSNHELTLARLPGGGVSTPPLRVELNQAGRLSDLLGTLAGRTPLGLVRLEYADAAGVTFAIALQGATIAEYGEAREYGRLLLEYGAVVLGHRTQGVGGALGPWDAWGWSRATDAPITSPALLDAPAVPPADGSITEPVAYYLHLDGIDGDAAVASHAGWFALTHYGLTMPAGLPTDAAAPLLNIGLPLTTQRGALLAALAGGDVLARARIDGVNSVGVTVYRVALEEVRITGLNDNGENGYLELDYDRIVVGNRTQAGGGAPGPWEAAGWDRSADAAIAGTALLDAPVSAQLHPGATVPSAWYLHLDGIDGGATDAGRAGWFRVDSYSLRTGAAGVPGFDPLLVFLPIDTQRDSLLTTFATGTRLPGARLEGVNALGEVVRAIALQDVGIAEYGDRDGGDFLYLDYGAIVAGERAALPGGALGPWQGGGWNFASATPIAGTALLTAPVVASGQPTSPEPVQYFLFIAGLAGDVTDAAHNGWFRVDYPFIGFARDESANTFQPLSVTLDLDVQAHRMLAALAGGTAFSQVRLDGVSATGATVRSTLLVDARLVSYRDQNQRGTLEFDYRVIATGERPLGPGNTLGLWAAAGWDRAAQAPVDGAALLAATQLYPPLTPNAPPSSYYLFIPGIAGDATDEGHVGWFRIDVRTLDLAALLAPALENRPLSVQLLQVLPAEKLLLALASGRPLGDVRIDGVDAMGRTVHAIALQGARLSQLEDAGSRTLGFDFARIVAGNRRNLPGGALADWDAAGWDRAAQAPITSPALLQAALSAPARAMGGPRDAFYLYVPGIDGGSTRIGHEGWFEIEGYSFDLAAAQPAPDGLAPVQVYFPDAARFDALLTALGVGTSFAGIRIDGVDTDGRTSLALALREARVAGYHRDQFGAHTASFEYRTIVLGERPPDLFGGLDPWQGAGWDTQTKLPVDALALIELPGTPDNDELTGGSDPNRLLGFAGHDVLIAGPGTQAMLAGDGKDFMKLSGNTATVVDDGPGDDLVQGFIAGPAGNARLDLRRLPAVQSLPDALAFATDIGGNTLFDFGAGDGLWLEGVAKGKLDAGDFIFAQTQLLSVARANASRPEGQAGATDLTFTIIRSGGAAGAVQTAWSVSGGGVAGTVAATAADFVGGALPWGLVTLADGQATTTVTIAVQGDTAVELNDSFTVTLFAPTGGAALGKASATGAILNDDTALSIAAAKASKAEGSGIAPTPFTFIITRSGNLATSETVKWYADGADGKGTLRADAADFPGGVLPTGHTTFAPGETARTITVPVAADRRAELNERFAVTIYAPSAGSLITAASATGTILNDDTVGTGTLTLSRLVASQSEGQVGATLFSYLVTRTGDTKGAATADWSVTGTAGPGTVAATGADFVGGALPAGTIAFAAGETTRVVSVPVQADGINELNESFTLTLANPQSGVTLATASATGLIWNDDTPGTGTLSIAAANATRAEGNTGGNPFTFTVSRTGDTKGSASADWAVAGGGVQNTAPAGAEDYAGAVQPRGRIDFLPGQTSRTITVTILGDTLPEPSDSFGVTLSGPQSGVLIGKATATGLILDDDTYVSTAANQMLTGTDGPEIFLLGGGNDTVTAKGGLDLFQFRPSALGPAATTTTTLADLSRAAGETLDLSAIDAIAGTAGNDAFSFIGTAAFSAPGQLRWQDLGATRLIQGSTDADAIAELTILASAAGPVDAGWFVL